MNDVAKISKNEMIKGGTKLNLVQRVTSEFKTIQDYLKKRKWQKKNKWMGLYPGDLVEIDGRYYLYRGLIRWEDLACLEWQNLHSRPRIQQTRN